MIAYTISYATCGIVYSRYEPAVKSAHPPYTCLSPMTTPRSWDSLIMIAPRRFTRIQSSEIKMPDGQSGLQKLTRNQLEVYFHLKIPCLTFPTDCKYITFF